ncbi:catalase/peroxidase HPI [Acuticoccus sp. MNP-M23]|uniref:catalase/peroxidase HPI n=1 Tax=Acuticoccus sp. MNP-M23 TaxID=3072793 RepID=UPI002815EAF8|nr:catalase/peroxidase HPI [Acuticoccus sp. MNP-M23]WMS41917.1 catalase/peroxidase HPI [Acuticoccus sp. MNP-M23]
MNEHTKPPADMPIVQEGGTCPFGGSRVAGAIGSHPTIDDWWPNRLKVEILHQNPPMANPYGEAFDYAAAFRTLDIAAVKADIKALLTDAQPWWPADYDNYGPQMIRMAWHMAGTYRIADGRGGAGQGMQRFAPINSWWDNGNTDKSRRLLLPIKNKYGKAISWADLYILTGNCALEIMGFPTFGYGGGRIDAWEADRQTYWGPEGWEADPREKSQPVAQVNMDKRWVGGPDQEVWDLENPLGATHQALIYVNPEGPDGDGNPEHSAREIRISFGRMAMNDEETVALIAGGHAFGKSHGMVDAGKIGPAPEGAPIEAMGLGWHNPEGTGFAQYTMTNGIEGAWTPDPTKWDNEYLTNLFRFEWEPVKSPSGALQWRPRDGQGAPTTPDAHVPGQQNELMMMTSDIALKVDPSYRAICEKFLSDFKYFEDAFSRAWFKLTHRDMGPKSRYLGPEVPAEDLPWQDPIPDLDHPVVDGADISALKDKVLASGLTVPELVFTAWSAASTHRVTDKRGGANGARIALAPQKDWDVNNPALSGKVVDALRGIADAFNASATGGKKVSLADMIVLGGTAAVEKAAKDGGVDISVPFTPGRMDTTQELTDVEQFNWLKPVADGFRNYMQKDVTFTVAPEALFLDRAALLSLTTPEWTALVGGLRVLDTNWDGSRDGVFTDRPGTLTNDFFVNLTSMDFTWEKADDDAMRFRLVNRASGETKFTGTRCDLIFGSNAQLRQIAEAWAADDAKPDFVAAFVAAWHKVMMLDRYETPERVANAG